MTTTNKPELAATSVSTHPPIGTGTRKLGEWACMEFWPCGDCGGHRKYGSPFSSEGQGDNKRRGKWSGERELYIYDCQACESPWLSASTEIVDGIENRFNPQWWETYADHMEERAERYLTQQQYNECKVTGYVDARMVARLLPLDVFPLDSCHRKYKLRL